MIDPLRAPLAPLRLAALALAALLAAACGRGGGPKAGSEALPRVVVARPEVRDLERTVVLPGSLRPYERARLRSRVTGYLASVAVDIGDRVEAGEELARIDVPEMAAELAHARAAVAAARAVVGRRAAELELAGLTRRRLERLRGKEKEAVATQDVDVAAAEEKVARARLEKARADLGLAEAERDRLDALSRFAVLRAPFAGTIVRRFLDPGALVLEGTSSDAEPVVEVARADRLRLAFDLPEDLAPHVRSGQPARISFDARPGPERKAKIARVAGALDPATRSMRAEIDLSGDRLAPGMSARVRLRVEMRSGALVVPSRAVRGEGDERYVLIEAEGSLSRRAVTLASDDGREAVVASGLSPEDRVVVAGSPLAHEGSRVEATAEPVP